MATVRRTRIFADGEGIGREEYDGDVVMTGCSILRCRHRAGMPGMCAATCRYPCRTKVSVRYGRLLTANTDRTRPEITCLASDGSRVREGEEESRHPSSVEEDSVAHLSAMRESSELSVTNFILGL